MTFWNCSCCEMGGVGGWVGGWEVDESYLSRRIRTHESSSLQPSDSLPCYPSTHPPTHLTYLGNVLHPHRLDVFQAPFFPQHAHNFLEGFRAVVVQEAAFAPVDQEDVGLFLAVLFVWGEGG